MLSLIGGIIILLWGVVIAFVASMLGSLGASFGVPEAGTMAGIVGLYGLIGVILGLLVIIFGAFMYAKPQQHVVWGVLVLIFSILSFFGGAGLYLGLILGLVGGILGIVWKPSAPMMAAPPMAPPPTPPMQP